MKKRVIIIVILVSLLIVIFYGLVKSKEDAKAITEEEVSEPKIIKISAVGDIMLGRYVATLIGDNFDEPFLEVKNVLQEADIRFGNLECVLSDNDLKNIKGKDKGFCLKGPADMVNVLKSVNFNVLSIANNHIYDYDGQGLTDTIHTLESNDIVPVGAGENLEEARELKIIDIKGVKVGFLGYTDLAYVNFSDKKQIPAASDVKSGVAPRKEEYILEDIYKARDKCNLLFISLHWSDEYTHIPKNEQVQMAHKIIDAGADGILGHHAHNLQGIEIYNEKPIVYNMGNFIFDQNDNLNKDSAIFNITYIDGKFKNIEIIPCRIEGKKKVALATGEDHEKIVSHLIKFSEVLGTSLEEKEGKLLYKNYDNI